MTAASRKIVAGWREYVALPDLNIDQIKAKLDSGARTSAIHAFHIEPISIGGARHVRFELHPRTRHRMPMVTCEAEVVDERRVRNSGGVAQTRYVIGTRLQLGANIWPIELNLTNRDIMTFRLLIGRQALRGHYWIDPGRSYLVRLPTAALRKKPRKKVEPDFFS